MTQPSLFATTPVQPRRRADAGPRYTPAELARLLHQHQPTPEQAAIIAAPVEPVLVVAGAGSGKTETMAARVVWLVAGGDVDPDEVLGLTFTRKAAGELAERARQLDRAPADPAADLGDHQPGCRAVDRHSRLPSA